MVYVQKKGFHNESDFTSVLPHKICSCNGDRHTGRYKVKRGTISNHFFVIIIFLILTYKKNTVKIIKHSGIPAVIAGLFLSLSFVAYIVAMSKTSVANVVFIISTQTMFLAIFGYFYLKEKVSLIGTASIFLAMGGILVMVGDSLSTGSFFGNIVALAIPINFAILVMIVRKNSNLDLVPAIWYASVLSLSYSLLMVNVFSFFLVNSLY